MNGPKLTNNQSLTIEDPELNKQGVPEEDIIDDIEMKKMNKVSPTEQLTQDRMGDTVINLGNHGVVEGGVNILQDVDTEGSVAHILRMAQNDKNGKAISIGLKSTDASSDLPGYLSLNQEHNMIFGKEIMSRFFDEWGQIKPQVSPVYSLNRNAEESYWSKDETEVKDDQGIRKLEVIEDENGGIYLIATVAYRHEKTAIDEYSEKLHLTCIIVFKFQQNNFVY